MFKGGLCGLANYEDKSSIANIKAAIKRRMIRNFKWKNKIIKMFKKLKELSISH